MFVASSMPYSTQGKVRWILWQYYKYQSQLKLDGGFCGCCVSSFCWFIFGVFFKALSYFFFSLQWYEQPHGKRRSQATSVLSIQTTTPCTLPSTLSEPFCENKKSVKPWREAWSCLHVVQTLLSPYRKRLMYQDHPPKQKVTIVFCYKQIYFGN